MAEDVDRNGVTDLQGDGFCLFSALAIFLSSPSSGSRASSDIPLAMSSGVVPSSALPQRVAKLDMGIHERQRPSRLHRLHPEGNLAKLHSHGIGVDAEQAFPHDVTK